MPPRILGLYVWLDLHIALHKVTCCNLLISEIWTQHPPLTYWWWNVIGNLDTHYGLIILGRRSGGKGGAPTLGPVSLFLFNFIVLASFPLRRLQRTRTHARTHTHPLAVFTITTLLLLLYFFLLFLLVTAFSMLVQTLTTAPTAVSSNYLLNWRLAQTQSHTMTYAHNLRVF